MSDFIGRNPLTRLLICACLVLSLVTSSITKSLAASHTLTLDVCTCTSGLKKVTRTAGFDLDVTHTVTRITHYAVIYWQNGRGLIGNGSSEYAIFHWKLNARRVDANMDVPLLLAVVGIKRVNSTGWLESCNATMVVLPPEGSVTVDMYWYADGSNPQGFAPNCTWNMIAVVYAVTSNVNDTDPSNNEIAAGSMEARGPLVGDIKFDGIVDIFDAIRLSNVFNVHCPGCIGPWKRDEDLNDDGDVNIYDAILLAGNFGNQLP